MAGEFRTDVSEMLSASGHSADVAADLRHELERLTHRFEDLASTWSGEASRAFRPEWDEWHTSAQRVIDALDADAKILAQHGYTFSELDQTKATGFGALGGGSDVTR